MRLAQATLRATVCAAIVSIFALAAVQPARAQTVAAPPTALLDCLGNPQVRPQQVVLTCADANVAAEHLVWTGWGEPFAAATGVMQVNSCTPNCAAGTFHAFKTVLVARGVRRCNGVVAYTTVSYGFIGRAPAGIDPDPTVTYRCKSKS